MHPSLASTRVGSRPQGLDLTWHIQCLDEFGVEPVQKHAEIQITMCSERGWPTERAAVFLGLFGIEFDRQNTARSGFGNAA